MTWTLRERVARFGIVSVLASLGLCALTLLFADIPGGVVPTRQAPTGVPLWPVVRSVALIPLVAGGAIVGLLPLYRREGGGYVVGALVALVVVVATRLAGGVAPASSFNAASWQLDVISALVVVVGAVTGHYCTDVVRYGRS